MNTLSIIFIVKIAATVVFWCAPLILLPSNLLESIGFPTQPSYIFVRMLGWAYLALCVGYGFGLHAALEGKRALGPIWVGIISNGGAFIYLAYYGFRGTWSSWGTAIKIIAWGSMVGALVITLCLLFFGVLSNDGVNS